MRSEAAVRHPDRQHRQEQPDRRRWQRYASGSGRRRCSQRRLQSGHADWRRPRVADSRGAAGAPALYRDAGPGPRRWRLGQLGVSAAGRAEPHCGGLGLCRQPGIPAEVWIAQQQCLHHAALPQRARPRADTPGLNTWLTAMSSGLSRESVVVGFSESPEFKVTSQPALHAEQIYRLYGATLGRQPDTGGFKDWTDLRSGGLGLVDIAGGFVGSPEFQQPMARSTTRASSPFSTRTCFPACLTRRTGRLEGPAR